MVLLLLEIISGGAGLPVACWLVDGLGSKSNENQMKHILEKDALEKES